MEVELLTTAEAAKLLRISFSMLSNDRVSRRMGVPFKKIGGAVRYVKHEILEWAMKQEG